MNFTMDTPIPKSSSRFLEIPLEIRCLIYNLCIPSRKLRLDPEDKEDIFCDSAWICFDDELLFVNKQVRSEVALVLKGTLELFIAESNCGSFSFTYDSTYQEFMDNFYLSRVFKFHVKIYDDNEPGANYPKIDLSQLPCVKHLHVDTTDDLGIALETQFNAEQMKDEHERNKELLKRLIMFLARERGFDLSKLKKRSKHVPLVDTTLQTKFTFTEGSLGLWYIAEASITRDGARGGWVLKKITCKQGDS